MANCGPLIPIDVTVEVDSDAAIALGYDYIQIERSTSGAAGPFEEITSETTRLLLRAGYSTYTFIDSAGNASFWYRYKLYNSTTEAQSAASSAQPGEQDPALDILSIQELKDFYLYGLDLTQDQGIPYPDYLFAFYIRAAVSSLEHKLDITMRRTVFEEERHDFYKEDYESFMAIQLNHYPVISIESVKMVLPGESVIRTFPKDWIHIQRESGQLQIVPGAGSAGSLLLGAAGSWLPTVYGGARFVPDMFRVAYTAGIGAPPPGSWGFEPGSEPASVSVPNPKLDRVAETLKETVGKIAAFGPLNIAGDLLVGAGVASQSISIDGLSQTINTTSSATSAGFGARLIQYQKELKDVIPTLRRYFHRALSLTVV